VKYRFLSHSGEFLRHLSLEVGKIYNLSVITSFWSKKPRIIKPFYYPYDSWKSFYRNWQPINLETLKMEQKINLVDKRKKSS
jgi:hypothetical protein